MEFRASPASPILVTATVLRTIASPSYPLADSIAAARGRTPGRPARARNGRRNQRAVGAALARNAAVGSVSLAGGGRRSTSRAMAARVDGTDRPSRLGRLECPPPWWTVTFTLRTLFSAIPTNAAGAWPNRVSMPSRRTNPPSSNTVSTSTPRSRRVRATARAPAPPVSSSCPKQTTSVRRGWNPGRRASRSRALRICTSEVFVSSVPRPQMKPSRTSPAKGGRVQASGPGAGTTSLWLTRTWAGRAGSVPCQVSISVCSRSSSARARA